MSGRQGIDGDGFFVQYSQVQTKTVIEKLLLFAIDNGSFAGFTDPNGVVPSLAQSRICWIENRTPTLEFDAFCKEMHAKEESTVAASLRAALCAIVRAGSQPCSFGKYPTSRDVR